jgi:steroid Delta-isomerase
MEANAAQKTIDAYFAAFKARDADAFVACFAEDGAIEEPIGQPPKRGQAAIRAFITQMMGRFEAVELVPERTVINLPSAAIVWTGQVVTKDGRSFPAQGIEVLDFTEEGQIALRRAFVG